MSNKSVLYRNLKEPICFRRFGSVPVLRLTEWRFRFGFRFLTLYRFQVRKWSWSFRFQSPVWTTVQHRDEQLSFYSKTIFRSSSVHFALFIDVEGSPWRTRETEWRLNMGLPTRVRSDVTASTCVTNAARCRNIGWEWVGCSRKNTRIWIT